MIKKLNLFGLILTLLWVSLIQASANSYVGINSQKPHRLIVLSDIEADPDDTQSFVRLLLYANQIDIKGLVATTSCWHKTEVNPESLKK